MTVGTCGRCNGPVVVPDVWHGIHPPTPQCAHCHAIPIESHGRVLPMREPIPRHDPHRRGGSW